MSLLIRDTSQVYRHQVVKAVGRDATAEQVLDHLFGDGMYSDAEANFVIREWRGSDKTRTQRLNMLWAIPLTIALAPFRYVLYGDSGWDTKTRMGRFMLRVTGHLKDAEGKV